MLLQEELYFFDFEAFFSDEMQLYSSKGRKDLLDINTALRMTDEMNVEIKDDFNAVIL